MRRRTLFIAAVGTSLVALGAAGFLWRPGTTEPSVVTLDRAGALSNGQENGDAAATRGADSRTPSPLAGEISHAGARAAIADILRREYQLQKLSPDDVQILLSGENYDLAAYDLVGELAYVVYDKKGNNISSTAPTGEHMILTPSDNTVLFLEDSRILVYWKDSDMIRELNGSHLDSNRGETYSQTYSGNPLPQIASLRETSISLRVFRATDGQGTTFDPPVPIRTVTIPIPAADPKND